MNLCIYEYINPQNRKNSENLQQGPSLVWEEERARGHFPSKGTVQCLVLESCKALTVLKLA